MAAGQEAAVVRWVLGGWLLGWAALAWAGEQPTASHPVVAEASLSAEKAKPGATLTLLIKAKTAPTWHIYAVGERAGTEIPTTLKLKLPKGVEADGDWICPKAKQNPSGEGKIYEGSMTFRRSLKIKRGAPAGPIEVVCDFSYQACDPFSCRAPTTVKLKAKTEIVAATKEQ
jgi:DsbC/DsbD-like thiol-disulfide interchange protein